MNFITISVLIVSTAVTISAQTSATSGQYGAKNVAEVLKQNKCLCPCKAYEHKEYFIPISRTSDWYGAVSFCHSIDMEIAEVLHEDEAKALGEVIAEDDPDSETEFYWIGANDLGAMGTHRWALTGRQVLFSQWAEGEPNNARGEDDQQPAERCVAIGREDLKWNDFRCTEQKRFICQQFRDN